MPDTEERLRAALDHIAKTAQASRSQTRRIRWIELRARYALEGREYRDIDIDLPKATGSATPEKLQKRMAYHIAIKHQLLEALQLVRMSMGWQHLSGESRAVVDSAIAAASISKEEERHG